MPSANRSGPCVAVVAGRTLFVVDVGTNGARNLQRVIGWVPGRIAAVFLTHYHSDHIDGLGELGLLRWVAGSHADPLPLYGPEGLLDVAEGFKREAPHRIEVFRLGAGHDAPLCSSAESLALVTDAEVDHPNRFALEDAGGVARFVAAHLDELRRY